MVSGPLVSSKIIMATIKALKRANGSIRYTAIVRIRQGTTVVHRDSRTFTHRSAAQSWARHREVALEDPVELTRQKQSAPTLAELIRCYIDTFESISRWQRSKQTHLEFLERHALGTLHESWNELKRYTILKPENLRDIAPSVARSRRRRPSETANSPSGDAHQSAQRDLWH